MCSSDLPPSAEKAMSGIEAIAATAMEVRSLLVISYGLFFVFSDCRCCFRRKDKQKIGMQETFCPPLCCSIYGRRVDMSGLQRHDNRIQAMLAVNLWLL